MILYNPTLHDIETDNHWLPAVHLADGTDVRWPSSTGHTGVTAQFTAGEKAQRPGRRDGGVLLAWPGRAFIKPDVTAPGVQILAGQTPTPDEPSPAAPPGEYFQAIAGTSMSSPHVAGRRDPAEGRCTRPGRPARSSPRS